MIGLITTEFEQCERASTNSSVFCAAAERFPAGRKLLPHADGAATEAERRADRLREPPDGGEERPEEPHAAPGGGGQALPAGHTGSEPHCERLTPAAHILIYLIVVCM